MVKTNALIHTNKMNPMKPKNRAYEATTCGFFNDREASTVWPVNLANQIPMVISSFSKNTILSRIVNPFHEKIPHPLRTNFQSGYNQEKVHGQSNHLKLIAKNQFFLTPLIERKNQ